MTRARSRAATLVVALLVLAGVLIPTQHAHALGKVKLGKVKGCPAVVGVLNADPIVHRGEPVGSGHEHQFFGNPAVLTYGNATTYDEMVARGSEPCATNPADTAGYWTPTFRNRVTGELVPISVMTAYYRAFNGASQGPAQPIPDGTKLVGTRYNYTCGVKSGARSAPVQVIPDCRGLPMKPGLTTTVHIDFPSCMEAGFTPDNGPAAFGADGNPLGDVSDVAHFAYRVGKSCPAGFPIGVTELRETLQVNWVGDPADLVLSSDEHAGVSGGQSMHGDVWETWQPGGQAAFLGSCVTSQKAAPKICG